MSKLISFILILTISMNATALTIDELLHLYEVPTFSENSYFEQALLAKTSQDFIRDPKNQVLLEDPKGK